MIPIREKHSTKRTTLEVMDQIKSTLDQQDRRWNADKPSATLDP